MLAHPVRASRICFFLLFVSGALLILFGASAVPNLPRALLPVFEPSKNIPLHVQVEPPIPQQHAFESMEVFARVIQKFFIAPGVIVVTLSMVGLFASRSLRDPGPTQV